MPSDVEMSIPDPVVQVEDLSPPHHTPITVDDDSLPPTSPSAAAQFATGDLSSTSSSHDVEEALNLTKEKGKRSKPPSAAKSAASATGAKPKSTKPAPRSPSPSPPPPPSRPPLQTIRLDIKLGGPDNYEVDISALAKETGQRSATPVPAKRDTSDDSHSEGDDEADNKPQEKKRKRRRRNHASEYYDVSDPFIDDSELAVDERTFFAQTKQQGFYVSSGQVALLDVPVQKKPKSKKVNILAPSVSVSQALSNATLPPSLAPLSLNVSSSSRNQVSPNQTTPTKKTKVEEGTRESPIALYSDADDDKTASAAGVKRKLESHIVTAHVSESANGGSKKKRKTVEIHPFHPELEEALEALRDEIAKETWETKSKFPPRLKPILAQVALKAIILGDYDDNFFNLMPRLFPYNRFTMHKLIKRTVWRDHTNLLLERQDALLRELAAITAEGFPKAQEEWEKVMTAWERRQERTKEGEAGVHPVHSLEGTPVPSDAQPTPTFPNSNLPPREDGNDTGLEHDDGSGQVSGTTKSSKDAHPPTKKYRLTDKMKEIIWQLVCISNECCRIENEKNQLEGSNQVVSDQGVRKTLYQKIVAAFPEGWISSGQISREVSVMKKKYEKEVAENE